MRSIVANIRRLGLTAKLIIPFVVVFVSAVTLMGAFFIRSGRAAMLESLETRAEVMAGPLTAALSTEVGVANEARVQELLDATKRADADVTYAVVVDGNGRAMAATLAALQNQVLLRNAFEKAMFAADRVVRRPVPEARDLFEVAAPINYTALGRVGVLRIGFSTSRVEAMARRATWTAAAASLLSLLGGVLLYLYVSRLAVHPLRAAAERLEALAAGDADLTLRLAVASHDEIGRLGRALNRFLDNLHRLVQEIRETSVHVGSASQQLSGAVAQLSSGSQAQASSLEETAASLEEITGTVKENAESARQASQLAVGSRDTAEKGGQVVTAAVGAMGEINRSSKRIADIITVIDEIAFQTNLLALNAAVEAARAGEQGRGFAVVAAEVRNLAQRSAAAAKEIKGLIQDSVGKVEDGAKLVNRSGQTLGEIVASVKRVTDIIAEIAAASQEQSAGIDQVNRAVGQMDQVVQANAAQTEEMSSTARALAAQAAELQALVGRFKLQSGDAAEVPVAAVPVPEARPASPIRARGARVLSTPPAPALATVPRGHGSARGRDDSFEEF